MEPIMVDDSAEWSPAPSSTDRQALAAKMFKISAYKITRHTAAKWAQDLRYLVYDSGNIVSDTNQLGFHALPATELSSDGPEMCSSSIVRDREETAPCVPITTAALDLLSETTRLTSHQDLSILPSEGDKNNLEIGDTIPLPMAKAAYSQTDSTGQNSPRNSDRRALEQASDGTKERSCEKCEILPDFPPYGAPTTFKVVSGIGCGHFIAVSYCWPKDPMGNFIECDRTYRICTNISLGKRTERVNRAPNTVIDRAVEFARACGIRMIWIDQECLPQDTSKEQELAIQAMDMVYQRAYATVGLFESILRHQNYLDAAASVLHWGRTGRLMTTRLDISPTDVARDLTLFLELIGNDQWNTRAWILQESLAASERLMILLRTDLRANISFSAPSHVLSCPQIIKGTFNITMRDMQNLSSVSRRFFSSPGFYSNGIRSCDLEPKRIENAIAKLERMRPKTVMANHQGNYLYAEGGVNYGKRMKCSAAVALTFLGERRNFRPADRLAIMANLCDYEVRLDTRELEVRFESLSTCLLTLAIMNGDLSLLNPDAYPTLELQTVENLSWLAPLESPFASINANRLRMGHLISLRNPFFYRLSEQGLSCPAYLWDVDRKVDLTRVARKYQSMWEALKCYHVTRRNNELMENYYERTGGILMKLYQRRQEMRRGEITEWSPDDDPTVRGILLAERVEKDKACQEMISRILIDVLVHLCDGGENALANSIWQSLRVDALSLPEKSEVNHKEKGYTELPDTAEALLKQDELLRHQLALFQLDPDRNGSFRQVWLIDRIMRDGSLWVAKYRKREKLILEVPYPRDDAYSVAPSEEDRSQHGEINPFKRLEDKTLLERQISRQVMAMLVKAVHDDDRSNGGVNLGNLVSYTHMLCFDTMSDATERRRAQKVSVFDVNGPCTIATPYDADTEIMPHPEDRSMRICWVVERLAERDADEMQAEIATSASPTEEELSNQKETTKLPQAKQFCSSKEDHAQHEGRQARQDSELSVSEETNSSTSINLQTKPSTGATVNAEEQCRSNQVADTSSSAMIKQDDGEGVSSNVNRALEAGNYRVVKKVRGMWEMIEYPLQQYRFV